jgi:alpha-ketoglutarate-dependent taurine dioxygenase
MSQPPRTSTLRPGARLRRPMPSTTDDMVVASHAEDGGPLPLVMTPAVDGVSLPDWAALHRERLRDTLLTAGGLLFRGFDMTAPQTFERFISALSGPLLEYRERSSPRTQVSGNIYTSTDHPADQTIFPHNENSYQQSWPMKIFFYADTPAARGGETPIVDTRRVLQSIDPAVRERFAEAGVSYVRNFTSQLGLPWQTVFQTDDRDAVTAYCEQAGIRCEWKPGGGLTTRQVRPAIVAHPVTQEPLWFNHAAFFHVSTLEHVTGQPLGSVLGDDLPNNTYYGDGTSIDAAVLAHIRECYWAHLRPHTWRRGDILMLDNMLVAHGRAPYEGARRILVGMSEPYSPASLA